MTTLKEKQADTSTSKEKLQSPKNVPCSICLDAVESAGDRSVARLKCGHHFHLDCIGSAFNAKGAMQCPNCRQVEGGQWLFSSGCYLQQQILTSSNSDEDYSHAGMLYNMYRYDERSSHPSRRPPYGAYRQMPVENDYPSSTNRWSAEVPAWNARLNQIVRPLTSDLDSLHGGGGMYIQSSQSLTMHRAPLHGSALPNSQMLEGPMPTQLMDEDDFLYHREPAPARYVLNRGAGDEPAPARYVLNRGAGDEPAPARYVINRGAGDEPAPARYVINRGAGDGGREVAFNLLPFSNVGNVEQSMASRFQNVRYGQLAGEAYNTRRVGAYASHIPSGHEWGSSHEAVRRVLPNAYNAEVHHLHPLNRAGPSHSYYDGHQLGARVPWL